MKNLIIILVLLTSFSTKAQLLSPEEFFTDVKFIPATEFIANANFNEIDTTQLKDALLIITKGYMDKEGLDQYGERKWDVDLVIYPINSEEIDFYETERKIVSPFIIFYSELSDFFNKVNKGFELLNVSLNDTISYEDLEFKYAEGKWLQAMNELEKAESIFLSIESLPFEDNRLRFIHASRIRLAQIQLKKGLKDEAMNWLYKVDDKKLLKFSPDLYYDSSFNYNKIGPSERLINHIKETKK